MSRRLRQVKSEIPNRFIKAKIKMERSKTPMRFSRRLRQLPPEYTICFDNIRRILKKERLEEINVISQESSIQFRHRCRGIKHRKLHYPQKAKDSKEIISILSAPKMSNKKNLASKKFLEVPMQVRGSSCRPKVMVKGHVHRTHYTISKQSINIQHDPPAAPDKLLQKRKKYVLEVLNKGSMKDIEKLHTVGSKTAERIILYSFTKLFFEHYRYGWNITAECPSVYIKEPADDAYLPILMAFVVLFCFGTLWYLVKCIYKNSGRLRQLLAWSTEIEEDLTGSAPLVIERPPSIKKHPHRIKSVDVFRGLCIMLMIFINYGGGRYWFFQHSVWNGITLADLVFPWFLWLMGLSLTVSLQKKLHRAVPRRTLVFQVFRRSLVLIFLGIVINSSKHILTIAELRLPGVLQRIGVTYFIVGILEVVFTKRIELESLSCVSDILQAWPQWLFVSLLVAIHTCVTFLVDVPGCGRGYLGPGGLDEFGRHFNCTGGVAGYIDRQVFGKHIYKHPACQQVYETVVYFDPEGILGTLTSILTVYLGVQAGRTLNTYQNVKAKVIRWTIWGIMGILIGGVLSGFKRDDGPIPLNKQLWSLSFTLLTGGMAFIIQASLFLVVDILRKWGGRPFFYPGMNAIILYVGHEIFRNTFPFGWIPTVATHGAYLFMNLWGTALWVAIAIYMYKHDTFFTI